MALVSTLDEINRKVKDRIYSILHAISPRDWDNTNRVFLLAEDDKEYAFQYFQEISKSTKLTYPICSITRELNFDDETDISHMPNNYKTYNISTDETTGIQYYFKPIKTKYQISIYHNSYRLCEDLIETLIFIRNDKVCRDLNYKSDIVTSNDLYNVNMLFEELPSYSMIPSMDDRNRGHGFIYKINIPLTIRSRLMKQVADVKKILTIITDVYLNLQEEASEDNKETYINTAS